MFLGAGWLQAQPARSALPGPPGRLGYWSFDGAPWPGAAGQNPGIALNALQLPGADAGALALTSSNGPAVVRYRLREPGGTVNLHPREGSVRFLYRPFWSTETPFRFARSAFGHGPRREVRLLEVGPGQPGAPPRLALTINPAGNALAVVTTDAQGRPRTNLVVAIQWPHLTRGPRLPPEAAWHEVVLFYSPRASQIIVDGQPRPNTLTADGTAPGVDLTRAAQASDWVFSPGSSLDGTLPAEGLLDEWETFDRALTPLDLYFQLQYAGLSASIESSPPSVTLHRVTLGNDPVGVRRRQPPDTNWTGLTTNFVGTTFTDRSPELQAGTTYEYAVGRRVCRVPLEGAPVETRGRVVLLVDQTLAGDLRADLEAYRRDLVGDGWAVTTHTVPRHQDEAWNRSPPPPAYRTQLAQVKSLVTAAARADPTTRAVVILGHVLIPYSGTGAEDGHADHAGAWPADSYYGDLDGEWADALADTGARTQHPALRNTPGDGKLDPNVLGDIRRLPGVPARLELAVGRIDFANLPALGRNAERELLRRYLRKTHRYRHREITADPTVLVGAHFGSPFHPEALVLYDTAASLASRLNPGGRAAIQEGELFSATASLRPVWGVAGGFGGFDGLHNSPGLNQAHGLRRRSTGDLASGSLQPAGWFLILKGSFFANWNFADNNFLRALLAAPDRALAVFWTRETHWPLEATAAGECVGVAGRETTDEKQSVRTLGLLGDPTLRPLTVAPPSRLAATRAGAGVTLAWAAASEACAGYFVYRSRDGPEGPYERLTPAPTTALRFTDPNAAASAQRPWYQVRALERQVTGSGAFTNLSQGVFTTLN